jgi:hypothetical protein
VPAEIREAALALTPEAIETLGKIMRDERTPPATRVMAADKILDRALGKAPQAVEVKGEKRDLLEYSIADLVAIAYQRGMEGGSIEGEAKDVGDVVGSDEPAANPPSEFESSDPCSQDRLPGSARSCPGVDTRRHQDPRGDYARS